MAYRCLAAAAGGLSRFREIGESGRSSCADGSLRFRRARLCASAAFQRRDGPRIRGLSVQAYCIDQALRVILAEVRVQPVDSVRLDAVKEPHPLGERSGHDNELASHPRICTSGYGSRILPLNMGSVEKLESLFHRASERSQTIPFDRDLLQALWERTDGVWAGQISGAA